MEKISMSIAGYESLRHDAGKTAVVARKTPEDSIGGNAFTGWGVDQNGMNSIIVLTILEFNP